MNNLKSIKSIKKLTDLSLHVEYNTNRSSRRFIPFIIIFSVPASVTCLYLTYLEEFYVLSLIFGWISYSYFGKARVFKKLNPTEKLMLTDKNFTLTENQTELINFSWSSVSKIIAYKHSNGIYEKMDILFSNTQKDKSGKMFSFALCRFNNKNDIVNTIKLVSQNNDFTFIDYQLESYI